MESRSLTSDRLGHFKLTKHIASVAGLSQRSFTGPCPWAFRLDRVIYHQYQLIPIREVALITTKNPPPPSNEDIVDEFVAFCTNHVRATSVYM